MKLKDGASIDEVSSDIKRRTGDRFAVSDWRQMNNQLFRVLKVQQLVLFIVIGLIVFVSTFNIVSTLIMTVVEKRREIGILSSMGAEPSTIRRVFIWYGTLVGVAGTASGIFLGVIICWILTRFRIVSFPPEIAEVYYVSSIPFVTRPLDLTGIALFALIVSFLATIGIVYFTPLLNKLTENWFNPLELKSILFVTLAASAATLRGSRELE